MTTYNGYESYDHWNTALWLSNDEKFYRIMMEEVELAVYQKQTIADAVGSIIKQLPEQTPDGAVWQGATITELFLENYNEMLQHS